jgi:hypothetical protein
MSKKHRNELIARHGLQGSMILRLQRFSLLGWFLFSFLLVMNIVVVAIDQMIPAPVIAVDEAGRVLGTFEFMDASQRTNEEILAGAVYFVRNYVNVNSSTIYEDYAASVNMMSPAFAKKTLDDVRRTGYLTAIKEAETQSRVKYARGKNAPQIIRREGLEAAVHLRGDIVVRHINGEQRPTPFDLTVFMKLVPRTTLSTHGLQVIDIQEKEIK